MYDGTTFTSVRTSRANVTGFETSISQAEIDSMILRAHQMRAAVIGAAIANTVASTVERYRAWRDSRETVLELQRLDDRMLADIGVTRDQIRTLVEGEQPASAGGFGAFIQDVLVAPVRRWRIRSRTRQELGALDDAMLRDIGIERGQIEGIAQAAAEGKVAEGGAAVPVGLALGWLDLPTPANSNSARPRLAAVNDAAD